MNKKSLAFFVVMLVALFTTLAFAFKPKDPNADKLKRLDVISTRLAEITDRQSILTGEIYEREMEYFDLNQEAIVLNEEASDIFIKLIDKESLNVNFEEDEPDYLDLHPSTIGVVEAENDDIHNCVHGDGETYRGIKWRCNSDGKAQDIPELIGSGRHERMKELLRYYGQEDLYDTFMSAAKASGIYPELGICIAKADTTLGRHLKTQGNIGNVGNSDSGRTQSFNNLHAGVLAIFQTLNNKYLGNYSELWQLTRKHNKDGYVYATSEENHFNNVANCIGVINNKTIDEHWVYRF